jgi:hypothetical protein
VLRLLEVAAAGGRLDLTALAETLAQRPLPL